MSKLIMNLTRFGDLIQTQPLISALAAEGQEVDLLCLQNFASAAELLRDVQNIIPFNGATLLSTQKGNWQKALSELWMWRKKLNEVPHIQDLINLTPSLSAKLLARIIAEQKEVKGFSVDTFGFGKYSSPWAAFLQAASIYRGSSPFNLVDVIKGVVKRDKHFEPLSLANVPRTTKERAKTLLAEGNLAEAEAFVGFQLGASQDNRRWPVNYFVQLGEYLWKELGLCPVLVGSPDERHLACKYASQSKMPYIDCIGKTDLHSLAGLLSQLRLLVTNDTGTMHLAAGLNVPILAFFLATAQPWDTGPYQAQSLCLEPDLECHPCGFSKVCKQGNACRQSIKPEIAFKQIQSYLLRGSWMQCPAQGVRFWESTPGQTGFIDLSSLSGHENSDRVLWIRLQREIYRQFLDRRPLQPGQIMGDGFSLQFQEEFFSSLKQILSSLQLVKEQLRLVQKMPKQQFKDKLIQQLRRLQGLFDESKHLQVLGKLWQYQSQSLGDDLSLFFQLTEEYQNLLQAVIKGVGAENGMNFEKVNIN